MRLAKIFIKTVTPTKISTKPIDDDHILIISKQNGIQKETIATVFSELEFEKINEIRTNLENHNQSHLVHSK